MTEVTYANLRFENSHELDNIAEPKDTKEKGVVSIDLSLLILAKVNGMVNTSSYKPRGLLLALLLSKSYTGYKFTMYFVVAISA